MASPEVIGLLCAGATNYHSVGGGSGKDKLSRSELAGLLAGLDEVAMNLALAKYAGDEAAERMLIAQTRVWTVHVANQEGWQVVKGRPTIMNLAALAVFEVIRPNRCGRCGGTGFKALKVCSTCHSTGFKPLSARQLAEAVLVDRETFRKRWQARYDLCYRHVQQIDAEVNQSLRMADRKVYLEAC